MELAGGGNRAANFGIVGRLARPNHRRAISRRQKSCVRRERALRRFGVAEGVDLAAWRGFAGILWPNSESKVREDV